MQRIKMLLQKINEIAHKGDNASLIDIDLMMDYTRVMYADMAEIKNKLSFRSEVSDIPVVATIEKTELPIVVEQSITAEPQVIEQEETVINTPAPVQEQQTLVIPQSVLSRNKAAIEQLIGINDKYQFISELFNNNQELYETTIKEIGDFDNYQEAVDWLGNNFNWNTDDQIVQTLYGIIDRHYNQ